MTDDEDHGSPLPAGAVVAGRFEVLSQVGKRATCIMFKTKDGESGQLVALRVLDESLASKDPDWARRVTKEAPLARVLKGPYHEQFIAAGNTPEGLFYVATEFLHGQTLDRALVDRGQVGGRSLAPARAASILLQLSAALEEMHCKQIIHGRLRPAKIFLLGSPSVDGDHIKLLDQTGRLRRKIFRQSGLGFMDAAAEVPYSCPEASQGEAETVRSDIYAWGIVAYEVLTGRPPFEFRGPAQTLWDHLMQPPPPHQ